MTPTSLLHASFDPILLQLLPRAGEIARVRVSETRRAADGTRLSGITAMATDERVRFEVEKNNGTMTRADGERPPVSNTLWWTVFHMIEFGAPVVSDVPIVNVSRLRKSS